MKETRRKLKSFISILLAALMILGTPMQTLAAEFGDGETFSNVFESTEKIDEPEAAQESEEIFVDEVPAEEAFSDTAGMPEKPEVIPGEGEIVVYFTLLGDDVHDAYETEECHTLTKGNLQEWIPQTPYVVSKKAKVVDVINKALAENNMSCDNPGGNIITTNTPNWFFSQNSFYTTAANRMSRHIFQNAINNEDVISLCQMNL